MFRSCVSCVLSPQSFPWANTFAVSTNNIIALVVGSISILLAAAAILVTRRQGMAQSKFHISITPKVLAYTLPFYQLLTLKLCPSSHELHESITRLQKISATSSPRWLGFCNTTDAPNKTGRKKFCKGSTWVSGLGRKTRYWAQSWMGSLLQEVGCWTEQRRESSSHREEDIYWKPTYSAPPSYHWRERKQKWMQLDQPLPNCNWISSNILLRIRVKGWQTCRHCESRSRPSSQQFAGCCFETSQDSWLCEALCVVMKLRIEIYNRGGVTNQIIITKKVKDMQRPTSNLPRHILNAQDQSAAFRVSPTRY